MTENLSEMNSNNPEFSVIIPAYNEEDRLQNTLNKIINFFDNLKKNYEIIVVDDGSKDNTSKVAEEYQKVKLIKQEKNSGKGAAVRKGMLEATGKFRIFTDADLSTPIYEFTKLYQKYQEGYDICLGSRAVDYSLIKVHQPFYREFMGKTFNKIVQLLVIKGIKDTQCGFKGFSNTAANKVFENAKIDGFGFDVEIIYLANKLNLKIIEIPVEWYNDERSKVKPIKDSIKMFKEILKIRKLHQNFKDEVK